MSYLTSATLQSIMKHFNQQFIIADIYGPASTNSNNDLFISGVIGKFINQLCHSFETW